MADLAAADLETSRDAAIAFLNRQLRRDWSLPIPDLDWDCERTLQHLINTEIFLALHLATGIAALPFPRGPAAAAGLRPDQMLEELNATSAVVAMVIRATPPGTRVFYGDNRTDPTGVLAVACDELLVHTWDIGRAFGESFEAPAGLVDAVMARLFPWAPTDADRWSAFLWCNGRVALPHRPRLGPDWRRWIAPLAEWDGSDPSR